MEKFNYQLIEKYMICCMSDSAHDKEHIYRVLFIALDIASKEELVNYDVLISACLLHDIGRQEQFENPKLCHAIVGAEKAYNFLIENKYNSNFAKQVASCIRAHRFRTDIIPISIEERILFDADKIDVTGALGIARTILYKGQVGEPLYSVDENENVLDGSSDIEPSFFQEYKYKLANLYSNFYTKRGSDIASQRKNIAVSFYENMVKEVTSAYQTGQTILKDRLE